MHLSDVDEISTMKDYMSLHLRDRLRSWTYTKKRILTIFTAFTLFTIVLFARNAPRKLLSVHIEVEDLGRPGVKFAAEDEWQPPPDWDPVYPVWTNFTRLEHEFSGSVEKLISTSDGFKNPKAQQYAPYPLYESDGYRRRFRGSYVPCIGPRGKRLNESADDAVYGYNGVPKKFPDAPLGSSKVIGLDQSVCFERHGRYGAYGSSLSGHHPVRAVSSPSNVDWEQVDWASLQSKCVEENADRFNMWPRPMPGDPNFEKVAPDSYRQDGIAKSRSAVVFRVYDGFKYTSDMLRVMRSVITELSLGSGGEYEAFLLVQVKDVTLPIFDNQTIYDQVVQESVPREFWNMTVLWNTALWGQLYPKIPESVRDVHASQWLPVQYLAQRHPNFDHYWNWEMDVRYTGHHYELLETLDTWTKAQPRKGLWERNARFYVPKFHGGYSEFMDFIQARYQDGPPEQLKDVSIWGPNPPAGQPITPLDDLPPLEAPTPAHDNFTWGVGEEADLITLLPMFNSDTTHYVLRGGYFNYPVGLLPAGPPRRATIITFYRISNRLLSTMHLENTHDPGHHMSSEQWPQSVALHHGFKAVYAPHSVYMDRYWPAKAANFIFNNGDAQRVIRAFKDMAPLGEGSGGWESVFGMDREHSFEISTWYYRTFFATRLYKRLLGYDVDGIGGETWEKEHGTFCLPPMMLHQIKDVEDPSTETAQIAAEAEAEANEEAFQQEKAESENKALLTAHTAEDNMVQP
ncbi:hypothetical protein MMC11_001399 [Xylographa trunciseda]|nr:hypothetical protein [Xylographa trunciseda]